MNDGSTDLRLNVIERAPEGDVPAGPPVVLIHGLFGRARNLGFIQRQLSARWRTLAIDLRSHGDSPHGMLDYHALAGDIVETLAAHDALPAMIMGHSMGGKAAMMTALLHPAQVERLVVADIPPARTGHGNSDVAQAMLDLEFPRPLDRKSAEAALAAVIEDGGTRALMVQNIRLGDDPGWTIGLREIVASMSNIESWPYIPDGYAYTGPTLFLRGANSPYLRAEHLPEIRRLFPRFELETIPDAGHWLHVEQPERFVALLEAFLERSF
jgi:pimeloyl-ACP methyl ester carboxylesterase